MSENFDTFLRIELPQLENNSLNIPKYTSLENRFLNFISTNLLDDEIFCGNCKNNTFPIEKIDLLHAPNVLQFKTNCNPMSSYKYNHLIQNRNDFPLEFNISEYLSNTDSGIESDYNYKLIAVSYYSGVHYTTCALNYSNNKWYDFNDSYVSEVTDTKNIFRSNASLLVYCKSNLI